MKKRVLIPAVLCGVFLAASAMAYPWSNAGPRNGSGQRGMMPQITQEQHDLRVDQQLNRLTILLDLTDQQQTQLKELFDAQRQDRTALRASLQVSNDEILAYRLKGTFDEAEFRKLVEKQASIKTEMIVSREVNRNAFESIFTADQLEKLEQLDNMRIGFNEPREQGDKHGKRGQADRHSSRGGVFSGNMTLTN
jgi:Spy/CpxP family protein refolding chaperone